MDKPQAARWNFHHLRSLHRQVTRMEHSVSMTERNGIVSIQFVVYMRPWTTNSERSGNRWVRASNTAEWRQLYGWLAKTQRFPRLTKSVVTVGLSMKGRLQDCAACNPAVKAAIDGMVDGGLLSDDTPEHLLGIMFLAPVRAKTDRIIITITGSKDE